LILELVDFVGSEEAGTTKDEDLHDGVARRGEK
jgi:hypothetical protein